MLAKHCHMLIKIMTSVREAIHIWWRQKTESCLGWHHPAECKSLCCTKPWLHVKYKSSSGDEIPERDRTYIVLYDYLFTTEQRHTNFRNILLNNAYLLRIMDVGLRKAPCLSCCYSRSVFLAWSIILSVVSRFIKYALWVVYSARFMCYRRRKTPMTLKSDFCMGQGYWKLHQWIPRVSFPISN